MMRYPVRSYAVSVLLVLACFRAQAVESEAYEDKLIECDRLAERRYESKYDKAEAWRCYVDLIQQTYREYSNNKSCASAEFAYNSLTTIIDNKIRYLFASLQDAEVMMAKAASVLPQGTFRELRERIRNCEIQLAEEEARARSMKEEAEARARRREKMAERIRQARKEREKACTEKLFRFAQGSWLAEKGTPIESDQAMSWFYYRLSTNKSLEDNFNQQFESCMEDPESFSFSWPAETSPTDRNTP